MDCRFRQVRIILTRNRIAQYTVRQDIIVPTGRAFANTDWGTGGYTQFYIEDFAVCFSPDGRLTRIQLCPDKKEIIDTSDIYAREQLEEDKAYNDKWLLKICGTDKTDIYYTWGRMGSYMDEKGWSSFIGIRYDV
jgi:hypothetical protein